MALRETLIEQLRERTRALPFSMHGAEERKVKVSICINAVEATELWLSIDAYLKDIARAERGARQYSLCR